MEKRESFNSKWGFILACIGSAVGMGNLWMFPTRVSLLIQGIVSDWMDVLSIYICPLGAGLAGIMFFWVCKKSYVEEQVNKGRERKFTKYFIPVCKYIYVPICFIVLILGIALGGIG